MVLLGSVLCTTWVVVKHVKEHSGDEGVGAGIIGVIGEDVDEGLEEGGKNIVKVKSGGVSPCKHKVRSSERI